MDGYQTVKVKRTLQDKYLLDDQVRKKQRKLTIQDVLIPRTSVLKDTCIPTKPDIISRQQISKAQELVTEAVSEHEIKSAAGFMAELKQLAQKFNLSVSDLASTQVSNNISDHTTQDSTTKTKDLVQDTALDMPNEDFAQRPDNSTGRSTPSLSSEIFEDHADSVASDESGRDETQPKPTPIPYTIEELYAENLGLRRELGRLSDLLYPPEVPPRSRTIYRVVCDCVTPVQTYYYDDCPAFAGVSNSGHIVGRSMSEIRVSGGRLRDCGPNVVLVILKHYRCNAKQSHESIEVSPSSATDMKSSSPKQWSESMMIIDDRVQDMFKALMSEVGISDSLAGIVHERELHAPYVFFHHNYRSLKKSATMDRFGNERSLQVVMEYFETSRGDFEYAESLAKRGKVCLKTIHYLFRAGQIIVKGPFNSESLAFCIDSYLEGHPNTRSFKIKAWCWAFDGKFWRDRQFVHINFPKTENTIPLSELEFQPLEYTPQDFQEDLRRRGLRFWKCRQRQYVRYNSKKSYEVRMNDMRYMIDHEVWRLQRQAKQRPEQPNRPNVAELEYLAPELANNAQPPAGPFLSLLPAQIPGFHMLNKRWELLNVSGISHVEWNKRAFESLFVDANSKEFVQALVTQHVSMSTSTDLIEGKGNSLVILLHGGPGTGKTLTAESVAELAEKPLYRVTCGDIGTDPITVERSLQEVLYLGKTWGCVVLLDEADIFLEERRSHDLSRNALVSCFLRALEYYDGILILTTNRVGIFDEAFKSRIQLSLRYENLTEKQRLLIWENFFQRLEDVDKECVDVAGLRRHGKELARYKMNGRQIRNSLTNARQLAAWKGEKMDITHVNRAIDAFKKFEDYTRDINQGIADDDIARESGIR